MQEISKAIISVMNEVNGVAKNMTVGSWTNSYKGVSDKDVKQAIRESMIKNGLSILPTSITSKIQMDRWEEETEWQGKKSMKTKQSIFTEVETKYLLLHTSGESLELCGYGQGVDTQDKGAGKATTYALKNTLLNMFLIPTGVDTDSTHSDEYDVPQKVAPKTYPNDDKEWFNDSDYDKMVDSLADGDVFSKSAIKTDYKLSKVMQAKLATLVTQYPSQFQA